MTTALAGAGVPVDVFCLFQEEVTAGCAGMVGRQTGAGGPRLCPLRAESSGFMFPG